VGFWALTYGATYLVVDNHHPNLRVVVFAPGFPHLTGATERLAPFSGPAPRRAPRFKVPGRAGAVMPFLSYSAGAYLGQVVEMILLNAGEPMHLTRRFDTHMAEALKAMVLAGHGLGWLPQSSTTREVKEGRLVAAGSAKWCCELEVRLYRAADRGNDMVERIWAQLAPKR
jgi:DNA-binding transcriptional LysR family regulator